MEQLRLLTFRTVSSLVDAVLFLFSFMLGVLMWNFFSLGKRFDFSLDNFDLSSLSILYLIFYGSNFFFLAYYEAYHTPRLRPLAETIRLYTKITLMGLFSTVLIAFLFPFIQTSRLMLLSASLFAFGLLVLKELVFRRILGNLQQKGYYLRNSILVGSNYELANKIINECEKDFFLGIRVIGIISPNNQIDLKSIQDNVPILGGLDKVEEVFNQRHISTIIIFADEVPQDKLSYLMWQCEERGIEIWLKMDVLNRIIYRASVNSLNGLAFINLRGGPENAFALFWKYLLDRIVSAILIIILSPVFIIIALAIKIFTPGPIFFKQSRAGLNGKHFTMYKFRSMINGAEKMQAEVRKHNELQGPVFKYSKDPRITKLGKFLRASSLDELPQLWNVLCGDMSLVGPRPLATYEADLLEGWHRRRLRMKPGITGLWQVSGRSDVVKFDELIRKDLSYIDNWSLYLDFVLLLKTIPAVLFAKGAR